MDTCSRLAVAALCIASTASRDAEVEAIRQQVQDARQELREFKETTDVKIHKITNKLTACVMRLERHGIIVPFCIRPSDLAADPMSESSDHDSEFDELSDDELNRPLE